MLINCPECGKEISDAADKCIHCGFPIEKYLKIKAEEKRREEERKSNKPRAAYRVFDLVQLITLIELLIFFFIGVITFVCTIGQTFENGVSAFIVGYCIFDVISSLIVIIICGIFKSCFKRR